MNGFPLRALPTCVGLRGARLTVGDHQHHDEIHFQRLVDDLQLSYSAPVEVQNLYDSWVLESDTLFSQSVGFEYQNYDNSLSIIKKTYWFSRLSIGLQCKVKSMLSSKKGKLRLKEICHLVDGCLISVLLASPEYFKGNGYEKSDTLIHCLMCNSLLNYDLTLQEIKQARKAFKKCGMEDRKIDLPNHIMRKYPFLRVVISSLKAEDYGSRVYMLKIALFGQTRATGLAGKKTMNDALEKFQKTVTTVRTFEPTPELKHARDLVVQKISNEASELKGDTFKVSISTSACIEQKKQDGGKFGYLAYKYDTLGLPEIPEDPEETCELGNELHLMSKKKIFDVNCSNVNVTAIRENGKARVVTAGSFYKDTFLQPYSHFTISTLKNDPIVSGSLSRSRHGWNFIDRLQLFDPDVNWIFRTEKLYVKSFDWTEATDYPTKESADFCAIELLRQLSFSEDEIKHVKRAWLHPKRLYMNGRFKGVMVTGIPMGDPMTKTNISLVHIIACLYAKIETAKKVGPVNVVAAGNGDDGIYVFDQYEFGTFFDEACSILGYKRSEDDCFVTDCWGTYCEEYFYIPRRFSGTTSYGSKSGTLQNIPYLDYPRIRLVIDTTKDRRDFSSDISGKMTLLGSDSNYLRIFETPKGIKNLFLTAQMYQHVLLRPLESKTPMFLPREIFGIGSIPAMWNISTWAECIINSRSWHKKFYVRALREIVDNEPHITNMRGIVHQEYHFNGEAAIEIAALPENTKIFESSVGSKGTWIDYPFMENVITKLITSRYLYTESEVIKLLLQRRRLLELEDKTYDLFDKIKTEVISDDEPTNDEIKQIVGQFVHQFKNERMLKPKRYEHLFPFEYIQQLRRNNPLKVDHSNPVVKKIRENTERGYRSRYERDLSNLYDYYLEQYHNLDNGNKIEAPPHNLVSDDEVIEYEISMSECDNILVVTDDIKLINKLRKENPSKNIGRIQCSLWVSYEYAESPFMDKLHERDNSISYHIIVDAGSVEAANPPQTMVNKKISTHTAWKRNVRRYEDKEFQRRITMGIQENIDFPELTSPPIDINKFFSSPPWRWR